MPYDFFSEFFAGIVTIHGLADKENPAVIDSGVFAWLIEVPVYF